MFGLFLMKWWGIEIGPFFGSVKTGYSGKIRYSYIYWVFQTFVCSQIGIKYDIFENVLKLYPNAKLCIQTEWLYLFPFPSNWYFSFMGCFKRKYPQIPPNLNFFYKIQKMNISQNTYSKWINIALQYIWNVFWKIYF